MTKAQMMKLLRVFPNEVHISPDIRLAWTVALWPARVLSRLSPDKTEKMN